MIIYISGPYSQGNVSENIRRACQAGDEILAKGHTPLVPHLSHLWHLISPKSYEDWLSIDMELLKKCDAILRLPGPSKGADQELAEADKLGLAVYFHLWEVPYAATITARPFLVNQSR